MVGKVGTRVGHGTRETAMEYRVLIRGSPPEPGDGSENSNQTYREFFPFAVAPFMQLPVDAKSSAALAAEQAQDLNGIHIPGPGGPVRFVANWKFWRA